MAMLIREMVKKYKYINEDLSDPRVYSLPLMSSPLPVIAILVMWVYFIKVAGPAFMKNRQAYNIDRLIQVYDCLQIALSLWLVERSVTLGWGWKYNWFCQPIDYSFDPEPLEVSFVCYCYFLVKLLDLLDTVFFVLRKKNNQVSFLHVYHHAAMAFGTWGGTKFIPGGHGTFLGFVNSIVHAVMYSYYLLTSIHPEYKQNIWWKKHITQMQMTQFFLITIHALQLLFQPNCNYPKVVPFILVPQNAFMFILFYDFYRKAYSPKTSAAEKVKVDLDHLPGEQVNHQKKT